MAFEHWKMHANGDLELAPLMGWEVGFFPMTGALRLSFARSEDQLRTGDHESVQLVLTTAQLRELATALLRTADQTERNLPQNRQ
jgi:hypothetical protein